MRNGNKRGCLMRGNPKFLEKNRKNITPGAMKTLGVDV
jgi:hypothetical protein